ncbi:hypothetical protein QOT17_007354 [Balamuthia mandrillaris]
MKKEEGVAAETTKKKSAAGSVLAQPTTKSKLATVRSPPTKKRSPSSSSSTKQQQEKEEEEKRKKRTTTTPTASSAPTTPTTTKLKKKKKLPKQKLKAKQEAEEEGEEEEGVRANGHEGGEEDSDEAENEEDEEEEEEERKMVDPAKQKRKKEEESVDSSTLAHSESFVEDAFQLDNDDGDTHAASSSSSSSSKQTEKGTTTASTATPPTTTKPTTKKIYTLEEVLRIGKGILDFDDDDDDDEDEERGEDGMGGSIPPEKMTVEQLQEYAEERLREVKTRTNTVINRTAAVLGIDTMPNTVDIRFKMAGEGEFQSWEELLVTEEERVEQQQREEGSTHKDERGEEEVEGGGDFSRWRAKEDFLLPMMLAVRTSVQAAEKEETTPEGVKYGLGTYKMYSLVIAGHVERYSLKDFAPHTFHKFRHSSGVSTQDIMWSWSSTNVQMQEADSVPGKGKKLLPSMVFSWDKRFIIQTITKEQARFLLCILPTYLEHLDRNPMSLLVRYYGLYKMSAKSAKKPVYFVVTGNVFAGKPPSAMKDVFILEEERRVQQLKGKNKTGSQIAARKKINYNAKNNKLRFRAFSNPTAVRAKQQPLKSSSLATASATGSSRSSSCSDAQEAMAYSENGHLKEDINDSECDSTTEAGEGGCESEFSATNGLSRSCGDIVVVGEELEKQTRPIFLEVDSQKTFLQQLDADCKFLKANHMVFYKLLVGVSFVYKSELGSGSSNNNNAYNRLSLSMLKEGTKLPSMVYFVEPPKRREIKPPKSLAQPTKGAPPPSISALKKPPNLASSSSSSSSCCSSSGSSSSPAVMTQWQRRHSSTPAYSTATIIGSPRQTRRPLLSGALADGKSKEADGINRNFLAKNVSDSDIKGKLSKDYSPSLGNRATLFHEGVLSKLISPTNNIDMSNTNSRTPERKNSRGEHQGDNGENSAEMEDENYLRYKYLNNNDDKENGSKKGRKGGSSKKKKRKKSIPATKEEPKVTTTTNATEEANQRTDLEETEDEVLKELERYHIGIIGILHKSAPRKASLPRLFGSRATQPKKEEGTLEHQWASCLRDVVVETLMGGKDPLSSSTTTTST